MSVIGLPVGAIEGGLVLFVVTGRVLALSKGLLVVKKCDLVVVRVEDD